MPALYPVERTPLDVGEIVRRNGHVLAAQASMKPYQIRALADMARCRTAALGGHLDKCRDCGHAQPSYNSCRNRHCPKCQALAQERWIHAREQRLLPVPHFHVVFTLPSQLRALAAFRPEPMFSALIQAATGTLIELGRSRLHADLGVTAILHTWTRDLRFHPHVHCVVTGGGLSEDGRRWVASPGYLLPVKPMGAMLRTKMMGAVSRLRDQGTFARFEGVPNLDTWARLYERLASVPWVVYAKKTLVNETHVVRYLGR